ncbi:flagellar basal body M-ring protein FliF, partial [Acinetobacter baumannii]
GNLELTEAGQITARLDAAKVPYRIANNGTEIYVPEPQVQRLRMTMAQAGLPSGGSVGYELFDKSDQLGATSFVQQINQVRALEGELARS